MKSSCGWRSLAAIFAALTCAVVVSSSSAVLSQGSPSQATSAATAAIVFGLGSPNISPIRAGTSIGVIAGGLLYLFDAGTGVERRIMEAFRKLVPLNVRGPGPVFVSHLHMDHTLGLPSLLFYRRMVPPGVLTMVDGGTPPLIIYGPGASDGAVGISAMMNHLAVAFPAAADAFEARDLQRGIVYRDSNATVTAFEVDHVPSLKAFGFRIETADRVIVISGDTRATSAVIDACNGCDVLFHEVYGLTDDAPGNDGRHTSATALGALAQRARPKHLVIYHDVSIPSQSAALDVIRKSFSGTVTFAKDLDMF
jgi:ribonuclease BN (tRNA processing enzyme)